jgi:voltage-gated potassium channel
MPRYTNIKLIEKKKPLSKWRATLHEIIFEADTTTGKTFDLLLIVSIILSVIAVMLDSVNAINQEYGRFLYGVEWFFTLLFTVEYVLRLICIGRPLRYATSFFGVVDLLAILPTYLSLVLPGSQYLIVIRILRVLRIFRVLKLVLYVGEARILMHALRSSRRKIIVFMFVIFTLVIIFGALMYLIEGETNGFTSIPRSVYWAVVTMTTVGYGDISPKTSFGQTVAIVVMLLGFSIIAVPTGIISAELSQVYRRQVSTQACPQCGGEGHDIDAKFCKNCGAGL